MITVTDLVLRAGTRTLLDGVSFSIARGDRVGLVGRNGAGKTTLARVLSGEAEPESGTVSRTGSVGYLPQGPSEGDMTRPARERVLSGRGLDTIARELQHAQHAMAGVGAGNVEPAIERYGVLEDRFQALGGYAAEADAAAIAAGVGLPDRHLDQPMGTLSGGQRRRIELARILFSGVETLLLDEPTNHLDTTSIAWLRDFLRAYRGGLLVISHDVGLLQAVANRIFHFDPHRATIDVYNMGWTLYQTQRAQDDRRVVRERANAEKKASQLRQQADRMHAKATKARAAQGMYRRATQLLESVGEVRHRDRVARLRFPEPAPSGRTPMRAKALRKSYGQLRVWDDIDLEIERGSRTVILGQNGAGKTTLLRILAGLDQPDGGTIDHGYGLRLGYYAQEHETLDSRKTVLENLWAAAPGLDMPAVRGVLGSFLFTGDAIGQQVGTLSGGERTRLALATLVVSGANVLLLDEPTNNLDPASRDEVLGALQSYRGSVLLVTHDLGAVRALDPQRVILLPEGLQDFWDPSFEELVTLT
ncbi:MAG: ABC-F family ATP-binding cassette domain-containing protein [Candidatus Dormiibacterota bacterium]